MEPNIDRIAVRNRLTREFSLSEIQVLCDDIGISYEEIGGVTLTSKALELVQYMTRRNRLADLVAAMDALRPSGSSNAAKPETQEPLSRVTRGNAYRQVTNQNEPLNPIRNRYALVVGIDAYIDPSFPQLKFCAKDAIAMAGRLTEIGYSVKLMHDGLTEAHLIPTKTNVLAELSILCDTAQRDDIVLVYFACHGEVAEGDAVLIMKDTRAPIIKNSSLQVSDLEGMLKSAAARRQVVFLDACHVGIKTNRRTLNNTEFVRNVNERAQGYALLTGSTSEQTAQEWDKEEHGVFTAYLLKGLSGEAKDGNDLVTVDSLKGYVVDNLRQWYFAHGGPKQDPTTRTEVMGDMILADFRKK